MLEISDKQLQQPSYFLYIHTPFCGTCNLARSMLAKIESVHQKDLFFEMNASMFPKFMQEARVESVPCLFIKQDNVIKEKVYAFHSIPNIYHYLMKYRPEIITG